MPDQEPIVHGIGLDAHTRCAHYSSPLDVVAIRIACCRAYYACRDCHEELADHPLRAWARDQWEEPAVLCGMCRHELTIRQYKECGSTCPNCRAAFNPRCQLHFHLYFSE